jgi:hypothetical protein
MFKLGRGLSTAAVSALGAIGIVAGTASAGAQVPVQPIGPNQFFSAEVNHSSGYPQPVPVRVDCPGPIVFIGETGHPLPGQTVEVTPVPTTAGVNVGFTGAYATEIGAFFGALPPTLSAGVPVYVPITYYDVAVPIPTYLTLPCYGSSQVTFVPLPQDPGISRDAIVPVEYIPTCPSEICPVTVSNWRR